MMQGYPNKMSGTGIPNFKVADYNTRLECKKCKSLLAIITKAETQRGIEIKCKNCGTINYA